MDRRQRRVADFINLLRAHAHLLFRFSLNRRDGSNHVKVMGVFELQSLRSKHAPPCHYFSGQQELKAAQISLQ